MGLRMPARAVDIDRGHAGCDQRKSTAVVTNMKVELIGCSAAPPVMLVGFPAAPPAILSAGDFDVVCVTCSAPAGGAPASGDASGGTGGRTGGNTSGDADIAGGASGERVAVRRALLDAAGGRLTAEVEGRTVAADVMVSGHAVGVSKVGVSRWK
eukprot:365861-Chlamydomonas_euryale.AAC.29